MPSIDHMIKSEIRKMARRGSLVDTAFKMFRERVFPDADGDQCAVMRVCFFAGCAEIFAIMNAGMDDGLSETDGDLVFMQQWVEEIERVHARTIATSHAGGPKQ